MVNAKAKGSRAEREAVELLVDITGWKWKRALEEGTTNDIGDLVCLTHDVYCVQVKNLANPLNSFSAIRRVLKTQTRNKADMYGKSQVGFGMFKVPHQGWLMCYRVDCTVVGPIVLDKWDSTALKVARQRPVMVKDWICQRPVFSTIDDLPVLHGETAWRPE